MDEQNSPTTEPTAATPDPVVITPTAEPPQAEPIQAPVEPAPVPETPETVTPPEPITEPPTAQMAGSEPLPESVPQGAEGPQGSLPFSKTDDRQENLVASAEVPKMETPITTQGSTSQPEPTPPPISAPTPMPAQAPVTTPPRNLASLFLEKAKAVIQLRKQKKLVRIMNLLEKKKHITNDEVEKLLHVSDATATRYLSELEKQGKITQTGKSGHAVTYSRR